MIAKLLNQAVALDPDAVVSSRIAISAENRRLNITRMVAIAAHDGYVVERFRFD